MTTLSKYAINKMTKSELAERFLELQSSYKSTPAMPAAAVEAATAKKKEVVEAAKVLTPRNIVNSAAAFELEMMATIKDLTAKATAKANELETLNAALSAGQEDLQTRYELELSKTAVAQLLGDYEDKVKEIEKTIADTRAAWQLEQAEHTKLVNARNAEITLKRTQDEAEYNYRTSTSRARAEEEFQHKLAIAKRNQDERAAEFERKMTEARAALEAENAKLEAGLARVAALESTFESKVAAAAEEKVKSAVTSERIKYAMEKKDLERELALTSQKLADQLATSAGQANEIARLNNALDKARAEVNNIATNAFASVSGQSALRAVMESNATAAAPAGKRAAA